MNYFGTKNNKLNKLPTNNLLKYNINFILLGLNLIYIALLSSLFYLDYSLFYDFFGFERGLFSTIFKLDLINIYSTLFLIFVPFLFIILFLFVSILVHHNFILKEKINIINHKEIIKNSKLNVKIQKKDINFYKKLQNKFKIYLIKENYSRVIRFINNFSKVKEQYFDIFIKDISKRELIYFMFVILLHPIILLLEFLFLKSILIYFISLIILNIFALYYIRIWLQKIHLQTIISLIISIIIIIFIYSLKIQEVISSIEYIRYIHIYIQFFFISNLSLLINYLFMIFYSDILISLSKSNLTQKKHNWIISPFVVILIIILFNFFISNSNKGDWSQKLSSSRNFTTNILLNVANLQTNSLDIPIKIQSRYYQNLINQITYDDSNNIITCNQTNNLNCQYTYTLTNDYLLLNISSNIKLYFKNLFIDEKFIGYRIFVIEEKKYTNKEGSEYILLATKNKFVKDFEKFDKRKELLAKLLPKNAIERINENTDVFKINKDLANQQLINQYYISYFEKEDNIFIYNDSISKDTLKSIKENEL